LLFPPILRIATELPASFQEKIRADYPLLNERRDETALPAGVPPELAKMLSEDLPTLLAGDRYFDFASADRAWITTLNKDFIALTARQYLAWTDFRPRLERLATALREVYAPPFFIRLGLRYRNAIKRDALGLAQVPWRQLLQPHIAAELSSDVAEVQIRQIVSDVVIGLTDGGQVRIRHGLKRQEDPAKAPYVIDSDFSLADQTEIPNALVRLDNFNHEAGRLFRWCIGEQLHQAMGPTNA